MGGEEAVVEYMKKLKEQNPRMVMGNTATDTLLVAGEFPIAIGTYLQNLVKFKPKNLPWDFVPLEEVYTNQPGPGYTVHAQAPHPNAGRLFMYWFVGPEGTKMVDQERFKGNPLPGSGSGPSKILEENKMTLKISPLEYELNYKKYEAKYLEALGLPVN
jgi:ABC-type Fe3+ transport system substrate-binding protein